MAIGAKGLIAAACGLCIGTGSMAAPAFYSATDSGLLPFDLINTVPVSNAYQAALNSSALVDVSGTQDFEQVVAPNPGDDLTLGFGDVTATLKSANGSLKTGPQGLEGERRSLPGGNNFWDVTSTGTFEVTFSRLVSAFSFWGSDINEQPGSSLTLELLDASGNLVGSRISVNTGSGSPGTALFWGVIASDAKEFFQTVRFITNQVNGDRFGFDTFTVGAQDSVVNPTPEPASLALVGLALAGIAATRRRA